MGALCARPTMLLLLRSRLQVKPTQPIPHGRGVNYTTHPSRTRGQRRQPVAGSAPKGDTKALPGLSQIDPEGHAAEPQGTRLVVGTAAFGALAA